MENITQGLLGFKHRLCPVRDDRSVENTAKRNASSLRQDAWCAPNVPTERWIWIQGFLPTRCSYRTLNHSWISILNIKCIKKLITRNSITSSRERRLIGQKIKILFVPQGRLVGRKIQHRGTAFRRNAWCVSNVPTERRIWI